MQLLQIFILFLSQIFIKLNTLSDQAIESKIEYNFNKFTSESLTRDYFLDRWGWFTHIFFERFELFNHLLMGNKLWLLFTFEDVGGVISENFYQKR